MKTLGTLEAHGFLSLMLTYIIFNIIYNIILLLLLTILKEDY